ncbi:MAG: hydroxyacid dehydrogenase [Bacillota bacterium]
MKILFCMPVGSVRDTFLTPANKEKLDALGEVFYNETEKDFTQEEYAEKIVDKDVVIIGWKSPVLDEKVLAKANKLKVVAHLAGSVAPFLCEEVFARGIKVICGNEDMAQSVAEGVVAYILAYNREICKYQIELKEHGTWKPNTFETLSLVRKTVGIVSYGAIPKYLAKMLYGFDCNILVYSRGDLGDELKKYNMTQVSLEELFAKSDIISLQTALNQYTIDMFDKKYLSLIKDGALLVNTARAKIIKEEDLIAELKTGRFSAILDVYTTEPLPCDNPYRDMPNVFMMPHMAGPTNECRSILANTMITEIPKMIAGEDSIHLVSLDKFKSMTRPM